MKKQIVRDLLDLNEKPIREGDEVLVFIQDFEKQRIDGLLPQFSHIDDIPIFECDMTKPLPTKDVPVARGRVRWDSTLLTYVVDLDWRCKEWDRGISSIQMGGKNYSFSLVD